MPDRSAAWQLLCEYTKGDSLRKHALAVEAAMRACAGRYGEPDADEDEWGLVGLLHDFDYEMFPSPEPAPVHGSEHTLWPWFLRSAHPRDYGPC